MRTSDSDAITYILNQAGFPAHFVDGPGEAGDTTYNVLRIQCEPGDVSSALGQLANAGYLCDRQYDPSAAIQVSPIAINEHNGYTDTLLADRLARVRQS